MAIPINNALIAGYNVYNNPSPQAVPMNLCKTPKEGFKGIPLSISPQQNSKGVFTGSVFVNLQFGATPPISQICSIYVDATQSSSDVTIFFPDTGYEFKAFAGNSQLIPVLTGSIIPQFYVVFGNNTSFLSSDVANIFLLNQFVPEFGGGNVIRVSPPPFQTTAGIGYDGTARPYLSQSKLFTSRINTLAGQVSPGFFCMQGFLTAININANIESFATSAEGLLDIALYDDETLTTLLAQYTLTLSPSAPSQRIVDTGGLQLVSNITGSANHKFCVKVNTSANISNGQLNINLQGGAIS